MQVGRWTPGRGAGRRLLGPLGRPAFRRLAAGRLLGSVGDWLLLASLVGWLYGATGSTGAVALLMLVRLVPPLAGGGIAAVVADRFPRHRLVFLVEVGRAVAIGAVLAALLLDVRPLVFAAVAATGLLSSVGAASLRALVPAVVATEELPAASAALGVGLQLATALGGLFAAVALSQSGAAAALAAALACALAASALFLRLPAVEVPAGRGGSGLRAGFAHLRERRTVLVATLTFAIATIATGLAMATLPRFLETLGLGAGGYGVGVAALAAGVGAGQIAAGGYPLDRISARWLGWALLGMGCLFAGLGLSAHAAAAVLLLTAVGFAVGTCEVVFEVVVQREVDAAYLGRVFGFAQALTVTAMTGAVALAPLANGLASAGTVLLGAAAWLLLAGGVALSSAPVATRAAPMPLPR